MHHEMSPAKVVARRMLVLQSIKVGCGPTALSVTSLNYAKPGMMCIQLRSPERQEMPIPRPLCLISHIPDMVLFI